MSSKTAICYVLGSFDKLSFFNTNRLEHTYSRYQNLKLSSGPRQQLKNDMNILENHQMKAQCTATNSSSTTRSRRAHQ